MNQKSRVVVLPPGPPEALAFALARYSRSADSIEKSLEWVFDHSEEKFWETFYFQYNHASVADLGHVTMCFEGVSELAAQYIMDEQLWDGQAKSTRYQDFSNVGYFVPSGAEKEYSYLLEGAIDFYLEFTDLVVARLMEENPKPADMKQVVYERNMKARAFDISRYTLPLAMKTCLGQVVSIRTLERQANKLLGSDKEELRQLGRQIADACAARPDVCREDGEDFPEHKMMVVADPLAPTLASHVTPNTWGNDWQEKIREFFNQFSKTLEHQNYQILDGEITPQEGNEYVRLLTWEDFGSSTKEIVASILYSKFPTLDMDWANEFAEFIVDREDMALEFFNMLLEDRGEFDPLPVEFRGGYEYVFEIQCDIGAWRDMHRHRRCQQIWSEFTPELGFSIPEPLNQPGWEPLRLEYVGFMSEYFKNVKSRPDCERQYLLPMATICKSLFKMDFAEAEYIAKLRSGVKGHFSYRKIACTMKEEIEKINPTLGRLIKVTPLEDEDLLNR